MSKKLPKLAKNIKKYRLKRGYSQEKLSRLADVSYNTLIKIESGAIKNPTVDTAYKLARALKTTIDRLVRARF